jgi:uncharacterized membrane protein YbaN (DUF454 family)
MFRFLNNQRLVSLTPIFASCIFETASAGQIFEMWRQHSALGQSIFSWSIITLALLMWLNFYRVKTPNEKIAIWMTVFAICTNAIVISTVAYFKYFAS